MLKYEIRKKKHRFKEKTLLKLMVFCDIYFIFKLMN
jgi:hypothetical protein